MTRFARAKGSKASNERTPDDSTPWQVMKEQLLQAKKDSDDSKKRKEAEQKRIENYENFLKEQKVQKRKSTWCDFPENKQQKLGDSVQRENNCSEPPTKNKRKNKKNKPIQSEITIDDSNTAETVKMSKKKKKKSNVETESQNEIQTDTHTSDIVKLTPNSKKKKKQKEHEPQSNEVTSVPQADPDIEHATGKIQKNDTEKKTNLKESKSKKNKKLIDGKPARRKEINDRSFQLIINGKDIELVRFDGFPVMKKDAERLEELKSSMIKKGIPKSEVQRTIKLERRRAEKALARVKRDVCYNCRKGGHMLSDCPELKSKIPGTDGAEGVCFKCGSTEHRQFECKVQRDKEFRFATCFICKEPGHIARQCPDNPKGLYPNGGNCKLCGDVTHLRKDCPTVMDKKEGSNIKLQTLDSSENIEDVGQQPMKLIFTETNKKPKKIKF